MRPERPLVSIGLPLYNAERYLRDCLESLLAQDYPNFEVVISDNASTDATQRICEEYTSRHPNLRYERAAENMGAIWNFRHVFELAHGQYFMWAAYDDLRAPTCVSACVARLEAEPLATLCVTDCEVIDEDGNRLDAYADVLHAAGESVRDRVRKMATAKVMFDVYGLARSAALRQTRGLQPVWGADLIQVFELCLRGPVLLVPEPLFTYRLMTGKSQQDMAVGLGGTGRGPRIPVCWTCLTLELLRSIWLAPVAPIQKPVLSAVLIYRFVIVNLAVQAGVRNDIGATIKHSFRHAGIGRLAVLLMLAALVYPLHNRLTRAVYRLGRRLTSGL